MGRRRRERSNTLTYRFEPTPPRPLLRELVRVLVRDGEGGEWWIDVPRSSLPRPPAAVPLCLAGPRHWSRALSDVA